MASVSICCKKTGDICSPVPFRQRTPLPGINSLYLYASNTQTDIQSGDFIQYNQKAWEITPDQSFAPEMPTTGIIIPSTYCNGVYNIASTTTFALHSGFAPYSIIVHILLTRDGNEVVIAKSSPQNPDLSGISPIVIALTASTNYFLQSNDHISVKVLLQNTIEVDTFLDGLPGAVSLSIVQNQIGASSTVPVVPPLP